MDVEAVGTGGAWRSVDWGMSGGMSVASVGAEIIPQTTLACDFVFHPLLLTSFALCLHHVFFIQIFAFYKYKYCLCFFVERLRLELDVDRMR